MLKVVAANISVNTRQVKQENQRNKLTLTLTIISDNVCFHANSQASPLALWKYTNTSGSLWVSSEPLQEKTQRVPVLIVINIPFHNPPFFFAAVLNRKVWLCWLYRWLHSSFSGIHLLTVDGGRKLCPPKYDEQEIKVLFHFFFSPPQNGVKTLVQFIHFMNWLKNLRKSSLQNSKSLINPNIQDTARPQHGPHTKSPLSVSQCSQYHRMSNVLFLKCHSVCVL